MSERIPNNGDHLSCYQSQTNSLLCASPIMNVMPFAGMPESDHCLLQQPFRAHLPRHQQAVRRFPPHAPSMPNNQHANVHEQFLTKNSVSSSNGSRSAIDKDLGMTDEDEPALQDDSDDHTDGKEIQDAAAWQRVKWTDDMVRMLINIVHAVGEDGSSADNISAAGNKRKANVLQKKGKWRLVSNMMNERKCCVSPQQCEDKFNDLNKRYKRLNDILGKDIAVQVAKCPSLLERMNNISPKTKDDIKKIISSKHTFYDEMHSFYSGNTIHEASSSQFLHQGSTVLQSTGSLGETGNANDEDRKPIQTVEKNVAIEIAERSNLRNHTDESENNFKAINGYHMTPNSSLLDHESNVTKNVLASQILQLQKEKFNLQKQAFELEKKYFNWQKLCAEKDNELEKLREENKRIKAENDNLLLVLRQRERSMYRNPE